MIALRLFGTVELRVQNDGASRSVSLQPKRLALLAYLAISPDGFHRRDTLLGLFWPELDSEHARGALSKAVHYLRRALGEGVVVSHGDEELRVDDALLRCDVVAFERTLAAGLEAEAIELYHGDLLAGFFLSDTPAFEQWLATERERLRRRAISAAWNVATSSAAAGNHAGASSWARRAHSLDAEDESGFRRLAEILDHAGDRAGALRAYDDFAGRLAREYELQPSAETIALVARIRSASTQPAASVGVRSVPPDRPPFFASNATEPDRGAATPMSAPDTKEHIRRTAPAVLRYRVAGVTTLAVLASVAIGYARLPRAGDSTSGASQARVSELVQDKRLLLADFEVLGADPALGRALTLATRAALEHSQVVSLISAAGVSQDLGRMQRSTETLDLDAAREVAVRAGVRAVVHGEITALAGRFVLALRLIEPESGNALVTLTSNASATVELLPTIDDLARQLRSRIGESLKHVRASPPLARVTTPSLDALQKYTAAYHAHYSERNFPKAVQLLQEAVALDPGFAMAWRLLAVSGGSAGMGPVHRDSALSAAFRHRNRASPTERDLIVASFYQGVGRDREKAASAFEAIVRREPDNTIAAHALATIYTTRREFVRAESLFRDVIRRDPENVVAYGNLVLNLWHQQRFVEAESTIVKGRRRFPADDVLAMRAADLFWFRNDLDRYERALDELRASNSIVLRRYGLLTRSNLALMRGRLAAHRELQAEARVSGLTFSTVPPMADSLVEARIDAEFRDQRARAVTRIDATLQAPWPEMLEPSPLQHVVAYVAAGRPDRARSVLQRQVQRMDTVSRRTLQPAIEQSWAWIGLAEGRHAEAVTRFRRSDVRPDGAASEWTWPLALQLALTYDAAGQPDSAIAAFERFLRPSISGRALANGFHRARAYERLGVLYESKGDRQRAAHYTAQFIELWKDADPELQPRVAAARQRLAQLRTPGAARN